MTDQRIVTPEIMDEPGIDPAEHARALAGLRRINRLSHTARRMAEPIGELAAAHGLTRISLLDIACGGGDVPIGVARELRRRGIAIDLTLLDRSAAAVGRAESAARATGGAGGAGKGGEGRVETVRGVVADACGEIAGPIGRGSFDVVTNSLFLHHLPDSDAVIRLLTGMRQVARRLVVISDLRRSRAGYAAAWLGCRVLSRSPIVHHDGPVSVRAAWSIEELGLFAERAGMTDAAIAPCSPWRMMLVWKPLNQNA